MNVFIPMLVVFLCGSTYCEEKPYISRARVVEKPQVFTRDEGESVAFPCAIEDITKDDSIIWNRGVNMSLYFVGEMNLKTWDKRISKMNQPSNPVLEIRNVTVDDADIYTCLIGQEKTANSVTHTLIVRQHPRIMSFSPDTPGIITIQKSDYLKLSCNASGKPDPDITWYHQPTGVSEEGKRIIGRGNDLNFTRINPRTDSGNYTCEAKNEVGYATKTFELSVKYKPEIEVDNPIMHAGKNAETTILCRVYSNPEAKVEWTRERDSKRISTSDEGFIIRRYKNEASLTIRTTTQEDFDNYTCIASNNLGQDLARIEVVGTPSQPRIVSFKFEESTEPRYTAKWEVISNYEVSNYRLRYRLARLNDSTDVPGEWVETSVSPFDNELSPNEAREESKEFVHKKWYTIEGIEIGTNYELQVQAENEFGQGKPSDIFPFTVYLPTQGSFSSGVMLVSSIHFLPFLFIFISSSILATTTFHHS